MTDTKPKIYIAGPMRGRHRFNYPTFNDYAAIFRRNGWHVENPAEIGEAYGTPEQINADPAILAAVMAAEIHALETCDVILLLDDWETSVGAKKELAAALAAGLEVRLASSPRPLLIPPERRAEP